MTKRTPPPRLEQLEDRTTPTTLTVSFVPDGTQIGNQQSQMFQDVNSAIPSAMWQQSVFTMLQGAASQYNITLQQVGDDGASMNADAPQDGQLRIAAVDQAFQTNGPGMPIGLGGDLIVESQVTFGVGLGLGGGLGGPPAAPGQPPVNTPAPGTVAPNAPPSPALPFILPTPTAFGNLFPTATSGPSGPTGPTTGPSGPTYIIMPSAPTGPTSGPTSIIMPSAPSAPSGPTSIIMPSAPSGLSSMGIDMGGPSGPTGP